MCFSMYISVQEGSDETLTKLYNDCVEGLTQFRSFHIQIVTRLELTQGTSMLMRQILRLYLYQLIISPSFLSDI